MCFGGGGGGLAVPAAAPAPQPAIMATPGAVRQTTAGQVNQLMGQTLLTSGQGAGQQLQPGQLRNKTLLGQ